MPTDPTEQRDPESTTPPPDERVLVFPADLVAARTVCGLNADVWVVDLVHAAGLAYLPRLVAELCQEYRHLCTYAVLTHGDLVYVYRRGESGGEARLHGLRSLGVGGHVNERDMEAVRAIGGSLTRCIRRAARREVNEEMEWGGTVTGFVDLGLIRSDESEVDRVHVGYAIRFELAAATATAREGCLADGGWWPIGRAKEEIESFETWSRILLREAL